MNSTALQLYNHKFLYRLWRSTALQLGGSTTLCLHGFMVLKFSLEYDGDLNDDFHSGCRDIATCNCQHQLFELTK